MSKELAPKKDTAQDNTGMILIDPDKAFPMAPPDLMRQFMEVIQANVGDDEFDMNLLPRIKMPVGGSKFYIIQDRPDLPEVPSPSFDAVALLRAPVNTYWASRDVSNVPPDCYSSDCRTGIGSPGGDCAKCPLAQWGTARGPNGEATRGKACKRRILLLLLRPGLPFPFLFSLPPTSLLPYNQFWKVQLPQMMIPYTHCVIRFGIIVKEVPQMHSVCTFTMVRTLQDAELDEILDYGKKWAPMFNRSITTVVASESTTDQQNSSAPADPDYI